MTAPPSTQDSQAWFDQHYLSLSLPFDGMAKAALLCDDPSRKVRRCRFCSRTADETKFRNEAHAVPELLGNRQLISWNECDECNDFFSRTCEDHLSKAIGPIRTASQIEGKKGVPSYKDKQEGLRVDVDDQVNITVRDPSRVKDDGQSLAMEMPTQPYIPLLAAKCLVKIACSIVPREMLPDFVAALKWVRMPLDATDPGIESLPVLSTFVPGPSPFGAGHVTLLVRRPSVAPVIPQYWIVVAAGNIQLQTIVPFARGDRWDGTMTFELRHWPAVTETMDGQFGESISNRMDWAGTTASSKTLTVTYHYDSKTELKPD